MGRWLTWFLVHGFFLSLITALTQVGGVAYLLAMAIIGVVRRRLHFALPLRVMSGVFWFAILYVIIGNYVVPPLASAMGREPLQCSATARKPYGARSYLYCFLGRNYVRAETREVVEALAAAMAAKDPQTRVVYLDASFPFFDLFPLPPHLSHNDGLKIDLAYFYGDRDGRYRAMATPSPIGYWGFEAPTDTERTECTERLRVFTFRWDMRWWQTFVAKHLIFDKVRTTEMLRWLVEDGARLGVGKVLIEPHLPARLGVESPLIRFQGCTAARHDDHVHVEVIAKRLR